MKFGIFYRVLLFSITCLNGYALADSNAPILKDVRGKLMVNTGFSYTAGVDGLKLNANDKVLVPANASGKIVREDCAYALKPSTIVTVAAAGCNFAEIPYLKTSAPGAPPAKTASILPSENSSIRTPAVLGLTASVAVSAAVAYSSGGGSKINNASPM